MFVLFFSASLLELVSIGLIGPYVSLAFDPNMSNELLVKIINFFKLPNEREYLLVILGALLISIFIIKLFFVILVNYKIINFGRNQQIRLRTNLMQTYQSLPYLEFTKRNSSEYIYNINTLVSQYTNQVLVPMLKTVSDTIVSLVIVAFLAWSNPGVLFFLLGFLVAVVLGYDVIFRNKIKKYGVDANIAGALMLKSINEGVVDGLKELRILGKEYFFFSKMKNNTIKNDSLVAKMNIIASIPRYLLELVMIIFIVLLIIGAILFDQIFKSYYQYLQCLVLPLLDYLLLPTTYQIVCYKSDMEIVYKKKKYLQIIYLMENLKKIKKMIGF